MTQLLRMPAITARRTTKSRGWTSLTRVEDITRAWGLFVLLLLVLARAEV